MKQQQKQSSASRTIARVKSLHRLLVRQPKQTVCLGRLNLKETDNGRKKKTIVIDEKEYTEDQLTDQQKMMVNHIADLERKIGTTQFNLDQLNVGRAAFMQHLTFR